ncbi:MAG: helix-turn-helix domain-containing protein [Pseudomonadota bacterium]
MIETIAALGMSQADLADRMGRPKKTISEIANGKTAITPQTALELERVTGVPAAFWSERERRYREYLARTEENVRLLRYQEWLRAIPFANIVKLGWVPDHKTKIEKVRECLNFFGVASPDQWHQQWRELEGQVAFRKTSAFVTKLGPLAAWLRRGELDARDVVCDPYDPATFKESLQRIRRLVPMAPKEAMGQMQALCAAAGVVLVFVPLVEGARASGATRWLAPGRALIQLSSRYGTDDHFWFTFFHEARHVLQQKKKQMFVDLEGPRKTDDDEKDADQWSSEFLVPGRIYRTFRSKRLISKGDVVAFAQQLGVSPGVVVGQLQHDKRIPFSHMNALKTKVLFPAK